MKSKTCSRCKRDLPIEEYRLRKDSRDGYSYICKACQKECGERYRQRYADDPEFRAKRKAYTAEYHQKTWVNRREQRHLGKIRATYGLEPEEYYAMLDAHDGRCAICGGGPTRTARLHVDHNHQTKKVRGMLCDSCNLGLGKFREDPELLRAAIAYLARTDSV